MNELINFVKLLSNVISDWFSHLTIIQQSSISIFSVLIILVCALWIVKCLLLYLTTVSFKKNSIYLLAEEVPEINVKYEPDLNFSFIEKDLEKSSIENRDTFVEGNKEKEIFLSEMIEKLRKYYDVDLRTEMMSNNIPSDVLSDEDIDYILNYVFTEDNIKKTIQYLNEKRKNNDSSIAFIGNKVGLYDFTYKKKKLVWTCYRSDHFTWLVFKELCSKKDIPIGEKRSPHSFFNDLFQKLQRNKGNDKYRSILMHTLCYIFSSLGIDALVTGKNCRKENVCLASIRSAKIDRNHISRIHVSVDESFSDTDLEQEEVYSVERWLKRGIEEEIGVPIEKLKDIKITYTDFSIIFGNYGEIGLCAIVETDDIDTWMVYPGKDKALESVGMFFIPIPNIFSLLKILLQSSRKGLQKYVGSVVNTDFAKYPWVEFAIPIYIRTFIRKLSYPLNWPDAILLASIVLSIIIEGQIWKFGIIVSIISLILSLLVRNKNTYSKFSSWSPLWNGNVNVLQLTGRILRDGGNVNNGLYLMTSSKGEVNLNELVISEPPLCSIRKSYSHDELPISFYKVNPSGLGKKLKIFGAYYTKSDKFSLYYYVIRCKEKQNNKYYVFTYSFNFGLLFDDSLYFSKQLSELSNGDGDRMGINVNALKCYFKLENASSLEDSFFCDKLPQTINANYQLCDLYEYKDSYYWSAYHKLPFPKSLEKRKVMTEQILKLYFEDISVPVLVKNCLSIENNAENIVSFQCENNIGNTVQIDFFCIEDEDQKKFENKVNKLLERSIDRFSGKINELETIAIQYILVRDYIFIADLSYNRYNRAVFIPLKQKFDNFANIIEIFGTKS